MHLLRKDFAAEILKQAPGYIMHSQFNYLR